MTDATTPASQALPRQLTVLIVLAVLILAALLFLVFRAARTPEWRYMVIAPPDQMLEGELNRVGAEGWEIVSARRATSGSGDYASAAYELILKRPGVDATAKIAATQASDPTLAAMRSDLRNLITAQEAYFADNVTYARDISKLNYAQSAGDSVTITFASGIGWSATVKNTGTTKTCGIFVGAATPPVPGQPEGAPMCQ